MKDTPTGAKIKKSSTPWFKVNIYISKATQAIKYTNLILESPTISV
ncbi:MAG: hypothetical protein OXR68_02340 [Alphaproteobacteria bacterium]|nr:hypothetical protein [Alphaproteobacteria bacterium]